MTLTEMHDTELRALGSREARRVLTERGDAGRRIRVVLARVYARPGVSTMRDWSIIPFLTDNCTIGVVDIADGTAWETGVAIDERVEAFGLGHPGDVYAATTPGTQGTVTFDGEPVQKDGAAVVRRGGVLQPVQPAAPAGWRQIPLPTWRGYDPDADRYVEVPTHEYRPTSWIRPTLVACHLMTCYGTTEPRTPSTSRRPMAGTRNTRGACHRGSLAPA
jgi:hypothetical protein